jgi:hypothetical protein
LRTLVRIVTPSKETLEEISGSQVRTDQSGEQLVGLKVRLTGLFIVEMRSDSVHDAMGGRILSKDPQIILETPRKKEIIGTQKGEQRFSDMHQPQVPTSTGSLVHSTIVLDELHAVILHLKTSADVQTSVCRSILRENHLSDLRLVEGTADSTLNESLRIVNSNENRNS